LATAKFPVFGDMPEIPLNAQGTDNLLAAGENSMQTNENGLIQFYRKAGGFHADRPGT
jgi:hypothetical protein